MSEAEKPFEKPRWAILELFGHRKLAGQVSDVELFGAKMCRIDIPTEPPVTQFYGGSAIYGVTPTTEELATRFARQNAAPMPINAWELQESRPALPAGDDPYDPYADERGERP